MAKEKKEIKEVYTSLDLIARGTYITAHSEFWDLFYKCFPELCDGTKIVNILYPDLNPCDDEIINFIYKDNSKYQYAMFFIDGLDEIRKISNDLVKEIIEFGEQNKRFIILELDYVTEKYIVVRQYLQ